ncbi:LD-carboxypeptidase [Algivirga pacifica]|uniref:LD-carboxypeptidase n=2 Tax=Algivirga pacifica TaxID=1162670 RepID=A0ABP9D7R8_9BACT
MAPAGAVFSPKHIDKVCDALKELGLEAVKGKSLYQQHGYLAGKDKDRAKEFNQFMGDKDINGILAIRGGWGCARMLPYIDYELARKNPKMVMGMSDITALLLALYQKSSLVTFHGLVGYASWNEFSVEHFQRTVMTNEMYTLINDTSTEEEAYTIRPGVVEGELVGGNLTVLSGLIGSPYIPDWKGKILFLEDLNEDPYRIDRMLTHLKISGVLDQISGFIFGNCRKCVSDDPAASFSLSELFLDHIYPLKIPAYYGANIGHITNKFSLPVGVKVQMDAKKHTLTYLETPMLEA